MTLIWLKFAWQNLRRNRRRSAVTLSIAALGVAAILLAGGFALYSYQGLAEMSARSTGHLIVATPAQFEGDEDMPLQHGLDDVATLRARLLEDDQVRQVLPRVEFTGLISNGDKSTVMMATGIDPDAEFAIKGPFLSISQGQVMHGGQSGQVMLGEGLARNLKAGPGSSLTLLASTSEGALNALDVTVAAVFSTGVPDVDQRAVYTDLATAQQLLASQRVSSLGVFLARMEQTEAARDQLRAMFPTLKVKTWEEQAFFYRGVRDLYNRIFGAMGLIIGVIVIFVVSNSMAMAVVERTREIGTLRAMGTQPGQLVGSFALEGLLLGGLGGLIGAALALGVTGLLLVLPVEMPPPPGRSTGYPLQIAFDATLYLGTLATAMLLSTLASALVARRSVRKPIVEALAHT